MFTFLGVLNLILITLEKLLGFVEPVQSQNLTTIAITKWFDESTTRRDVIIFVISTSEVSDENNLLLIGFSNGWFSIPDVALPSLQTDDGPLQLWLIMFVEKYSK